MAIKVKLCEHPETGNVAIDIKSLCSLLYEDTKGYGNNDSVDISVTKYIMNLYYRLKELNP